MKTVLILSGLIAFVMGVPLPTHHDINLKLAKGGYDQVSVLVQHPRLNHKSFKIRVHLKSEVAKPVLVKFFLAPKYDSHGYEIPLHVNTHNFMQLDEFIYDSPEGESIITIDSVDKTDKDWVTAHEVDQNGQNAIQGKGQFFVEHTEGMEKLAQYLHPKDLYFLCSVLMGDVGGMPFVLMIYLSEYNAPKDTHDATTASTGSQTTDEPLGSPVDRPLHLWQVQGLKNLYFQDVLILYKHIPKIDVPLIE